MLLTYLRRDVSVCLSHVACLLSAVLKDIARNTFGKGSVSSRVIVEAVGEARHSLQSVVDDTVRYVVGLRHT